MVLSVYGQSSSGSRHEHESANASSSTPVVEWYEKALMPDAHAEVSQECGTDARQVRVRWKGASKRQLTRKQVEMRLWKGTGTADRNVARCPFSTS
jgi:hypothetical protein